jgi:tetratricopeptide (TPR) repeat protein
MAIRLEAWRVAAITCGISFLLATNVVAQNAGQPAAVGADAVREAHRMSKDAKTEEDYNAILALCENGLETITGEENLAYTKQLMSWALNRRGEVRAGEGRDAEALTDFEQAIELDPTRWQAWHNRGVSRAMSGEYEGAIADFDRTIELKPNYANAWFNRGELLYEQGDYQAAIEDYNHSIQLNSVDAAAFNSRGHAHYRLGEFQKAVDDYSQAIRIEPSNAAAYTNRGDLYADLGQFDQAARDYRAAIRIDPNMGRAYQSAAWLMATCRDERYRNTELALDAAQKAIEIDGADDFRYLDTLAAAYANAGQFEQAVETEEKAIELAPDDVVEKYAARLALYKEGRPYRDTLKEKADASPAGTNNAEGNRGRQPAEPSAQGNPLRNRPL